MKNTTTFYRRTWLMITPLLLLLLLLTACRPAGRMAEHFWDHHMERGERGMDRGDRMPDRRLEGTIPQVNNTNTDGETTVDLYHFSDYHSHAPADFAEGEADRGGIARVAGLLAAAREETPNMLAFSGGDMMNLNNPIWSDEYTCAEWSWFNGLIDGMALGNHELDYGPDVFDTCVNHITYPILSSGLVYSDTLEPVLPEYMVYDVADVRVGVFAVTGDDYGRIVRPTLMPTGTIWLTSTQELSRVTGIVDMLRNEEAVDVVISIGHQSREEDEAMARAVPGIDLILGTHSHLKVPLTQIEGTETYFISPFQYLGYVSHVQLHFAAGELSEITGDLIAIDEETPVDPHLVAKVADMQTELEALHPERFEVLGEAATLIDNSGINSGETGIGNFVTDLARQAVDAHLFLSTSSSFRAALPPGPITREDYLTALPYANTIVTAEMTGAQIEELLTVSAGKRESDAFSQTSGVRYTLNAADNSVSDIEVIADPTAATAEFEPLDPEATYLVATTNFQAQIAADYSTIFGAAENFENTEIDINELVIEYIRENSPVSVELDGRVTVIEE